MEGRLGGTVTRYYTLSKQLPPPAVTDFTVIDEGNASPRFIRLTTNSIPVDPDILDATKLCIGALIQPLAPLGPDEEPIPVVDHGPSPIRCDRCRAYVNPFFKWIDQGSRFVCNLCGFTNEVPFEYRCNLDHNGQRRDRNDRPELSRGTVEFVASGSFITRPIQDPCYLFCIDTSYNAVLTGVTQAATNGVRQAIAHLAASNPRARAGIMTVDHTVCFYNMRRSEPQVLVMTDADEPFLPCPPAEILVRVAAEESRAQLDSALDLIASQYSPDKVNQEMVHCALGAAAQAASEALKETGGKVLLVLSNLPQLGAGALKSRESAAAYADINKEKALFVPQTPFYAELSTTCAEASITVDLYVCANAYVDIATIGELSRKTGGQIFMYPGFDSARDGHALEQDLVYNVGRYTGFDAVMVVRCSEGLRVAEYYGNFFHKRPTELDLPTIDCDKTFGVRLEHEAKLKEATEACIQVALLYTTPDGHRRIRVHTVSIPVSQGKPAISSVFRSSDLDAIVNLSLKQAARQLLTTSTPQEAQEALCVACIDSLFNYRKYCAVNSHAGQLILPEPLKLLPLNTLGLIKHPLLSEGLPADERAFLFSAVASMPAHVSVAFVCPRFFSLLDLPEETCIPDEAGRILFPTALSLSARSLSSSGVYLLDDSRFLYLWVGRDAPQAALAELFEADDSKKGARLRLASNPDPKHLSSRVRALIEALRRGKPWFQNLQIIRQSARDLSAPRVTGMDGYETLDEQQFLMHLIEDADNRWLTKHSKPTKGTKDGDKPILTMSYIDFLCYIHKKIQEKFQAL